MRLCCHPAHCPSFGTNKNIFPTIYQSRDLSRQQQLSLFITGIAVNWRQAGGRRPVTKTSAPTCSLFIRYRSSLLWYTRPWPLQFLFYLWSAGNKHSLTISKTNRVGNKKGSYRNWFIHPIDFLLCHWYLNWSGPYLEWMSTSINVEDVLASPAHIQGCTTENGNNRWKKTLFDILDCPPCRPLPWWWWEGGTQWRGEGTWWRTEVLLHRSNPGGQKNIQQ